MEGFSFHAEKINPSLIVGPSSYPCCMVLPYAILILLFLEHLENIFSSLKSSSLLSSL
jgi:hypothetical protein